jgi:hypothetical protein
MASISAGLTPSDGDCSFVVEPTVRSPFALKVTPFDELVVGRRLAFPLRPILPLDITLTCEGMRKVPSVGAG